MSEKIRLMIVDDEQAFIELIKNITDWTEHQIEMCRPANNGKKALELIETEKPDVVLTDIKMPVMDGIEFARQISARKCEINVVVMSGYDEFEIVKEAFKLGVKDYVLKSEIDVEELVRTIQKAAQSTKDTRMIDERSMVLHDNLHLYTDDIRLRQIKRIIEGNVMFDGGRNVKVQCGKAGV